MYIQDQNVWHGWSIYEVKCLYAPESLNKRESVASSTSICNLILIILYFKSMACIVTGFKIASSQNWVAHYSAL